MTVTMGESEIIHSRRLDFPLELVYGAWTNPEQLSRWWGPKGFSSTFHEFDLKAGGHWRFTLHGPTGVDFPNHSVFEEIVPFERIVIHHLNGHEFKLTGTFEAVDGGTRITFCQRFMQAAEFERIKAFLQEANEQNLDRLNELLTELYR